LEVEVYRLARMSVDLAGASRVAVVQAVLSASIIALYLWAQGSPTPLIGAAGDEGTRFEKLGSPSRRIVLVGAAYAAILGLVVAGPIVAVIVRSLVESSSWAGEFEFSLQHYRNLFTGGELGRSIGNSLVVGLSAAGIATILGSMYAWGLSKLSGKARSALELFAVLPLGISPVVLGLGYFYLGRTISWIPDILAIALVHSTLGFPFVVRTLSSGFASVPGSVVWAARGLGAGRFDVFRTIELPMVRRAVTAAAGFAFALSLGELNAAIMLSTGRVVTLPVAMYRLVAAYRFSSACALGTVLMGVALSVFVAFEGRRPSRRPQ
jgi:thiamine transport system permease protein